MLSFTKTSSWREAQCPAVHLHTVRTCADEGREQPSIILIRCMFVFYPLFAFLGFFFFWYLSNCYLLAEGKFK